MSIIGEKLTSAINAVEENKKAEREARKNDINSYIWKGEKKIVNGEIMQSEIKLIDATEEQLNTFYNHCLSMLTSVDKNNPGRLVLLNIIKDQWARCNTELLMRYLEGSYLPDEDRRKFPRFTYLQSIREYMNNNPEQFPKDQKKNILVTSVTGGLPEEFHSITLDLLEPGCLHTLGQFDKKHITLTFITKLGLWFDSSEKKEFTEEASKTGKNRLDIVKERCGLKPSTNIKLTSKGLLNYKEFRAMINLKNKKYSDLTTDQLRVLRDKVLFALEDEVSYHIDQWIERMQIIKKVADSKGYTIINYNEQLV